MKSIGLIALIAAVGFSLWLYTGKWTEKYQEQNCAFRVSGVVVNALSRRPLTDAKVRVWCREAKTSGHKLRAKPLYSTNYVVNTDTGGVFSVQCFGGSIMVAFSHESSDVETSWSYRNRESRSNVATNLVIELVPKQQKDVSQ